MNRTWTNVIASASITAGGAALAFFVAANVNAAVLTAGDLGFWGFVFMLAGMGSIGAFMLCFAIAVVADLFVRRLPASMSDRARSWTGGAFVAVAVTVTVLAIMAALSGFWLVWPTFVVASIAAGFSFVLSRQAHRRTDRDLGLARTPTF